MGFKITLLMLVVLAGCSSAPVKPVDIQPNTKLVARNAVVSPPAAVNISWDVSTSLGITNYSLYWGAQSQTYTSTNRVGLTNAIKVTGLTPKTTYFFAATATDNRGKESPFGGELVYTIPIGVTDIIITVTGQYAATPDGPFVSYDTPIFVGTNMIGMQYFRTLITKTEISK